MLLGTQAYSQLNFKVGYGLAAVEAGAMNETLQEFNNSINEELQGGLEKAWSDLNSWHGIQLGIRYRWLDNHAFAIGWDNQSNRKLAIGETSNQQLYQKKLFISSNQYHISYQFIYESFGLGIGLGTNRIKIEDTIGSSDVRKSLLRESQTVLRLNCAVYIESQSQVSVSIQPFYHLGLDDISLSTLRSELKLSSNTNAKEKFTHFGIRFVFYNGRQ